MTQGEFNQWAEGNIIRHGYFKTQHLQTDILIEKNTSGFIGWHMGGGELLVTAETPFKVFDQLADDIEGDHEEENNHSTATK